MAYRYKQIMSFSETYPNEIICAVCKEHPINNFKATMPDLRLISAMNNEKYKLVVWRYDENPNWYQKLDEHGKLIDAYYKNENEMNLNYDERDEPMRDYAKALNVLGAAFRDDSLTHVIRKVCLDHGLIAMEDLEKEIHFRCSGLEADSIEENVWACIMYALVNGFEALKNEEDDGKIWAMLDQKGE